MLDLWLRGRMSGKSGCQYPEWVTDRPAMFGLANGGFLVGSRPVGGKYHSRNGCTIRQSVDGH